MVQKLDIEKLKPLAYYGEGEVVECEFYDYIKNMELKPIGEGMFSRVFEIVDTGWVLKEAKWDLNLNISDDFKLSIPAEPIEELLKIFNYSFLPSPEEIKKQYNMYLKVCEYFGYFENSDYYHTRINDIKDAQRKVRESLIENILIIEKELNFLINTKISKVLEEVKYTNFLPKEFTFFSAPISAENKNKVTAYILQEKIEGKSLFKYKEGDLSQQHLKEIILFVYLILLLDLKEKIVTDTRPRNLMQNPTDWFFQTDNVYATSNGIKFIDTRWTWERQENFIKRGLVIPDLTIESAKKYINIFLEKVNV